MCHNATTAHIYSQFIIAHISMSATDSGYKYIPLVYVHFTFYSAKYCGVKGVYRPRRGTVGSVDLETFH